MTFLPSNDRVEKNMTGWKIFAALLFSCLLSGCSSFFFYPTNKEYIRAEDLGLKKEDIVFNNRNGVPLSAWWLPADGAAKGTILFLHGNAENLTSHVMSVHWLPERSWNIFILDYQGYGRSGGSPSFRGCIEDGADALEWLRARPGVDPNTIVLFGESLGAAMAINLAADPGAREKLRGLVAESGFSSFPRIMRDKLSQFWITWALQYPLSIFITGKYDPILKVGALRGLPVLFIHGDADPIVPVYHSDLLFEAAAEPKQYWRVRGAGHIEVLRNIEYRKRFVEYLNGLL